MRIRQTFVVSLAFAAIWTSSTFAEPATPEGAKALLDAYAAYVGRAAIDKGVLTVAPGDSSYAVTWNLQRALELAGPQDGVVSIEPWTYTLTPEDGGAWTFSSDALPAIEIKTQNGQTVAKQTFDFDGFEASGRYDPAHEPFLEGKASLDSAKRALRAADDKDADPLEEDSYDNLKLGARAQSSPNGGVDFAFTSSSGAYEQKMSLSRLLSSDAGDLTGSGSGGAGGGSFKGLRVAEIAAIWKFVVAHAADDKQPPGVAPLLAAALPLWNAFETDGDTRDLKFDSNMGSLGLPLARMNLALTGVAHRSRMGFGFEFRDLDFRSPLLPPIAARLSPISLKLAMSLEAEGLDDAARLALADPHLTDDKGLSPDTQAAMQAAVMAKTPKFVFEPSRLAVPGLDLAFSGEVSINPQLPKARFHVTADSLDAAMKIATEAANADQSVQGAVLALGLVKGLAKTDADGRLSWDVTVEGNSVTVNGSPLSTGQ